MRMRNLTLVIRTLIEEPIFSLIENLIEGIEKSFL
jgi:hypothetical protein